MSASLETSSKSAPKAKDVGTESRQTARDIPTKSCERGQVKHPPAAPLRSAEAAESPETSSTSVCESSDEWT
eukprot:347674-Pyramimonas_sp.AAC.1